MGGDNVIIAAAHAQLANICLHNQRRVRPLQSTICFIPAVAVALFPLCLTNPSVTVLQKDAMRHAQKAIELDLPTAAVELCTKTSDDADGTDTLVCGPHRGRATDSNHVSQR